MMTSTPMMIETTPRLSTSSGYAWLGGLSQHVRPRGMQHFTHHAHLAPVVGARHVRPVNLGALTGLLERHLAALQMLEGCLMRS